MEKYILDRIEGQYAILEDKDGNIIEIGIDKIKGKFKESDVLVKEKEFFVANNHLSEKYKNKIDNTIKNMWE